METEKKKLTDNQLRIAQGVAGIISAAALMVSIAFSQALSLISDLLGYLFVVVFVVITMGRRRVENKYRIRLNFYNLILLDGITVGMLILLIINFYFSKEPLITSEIIKLLVVIGVSLLLLVLGVALPIRKYLKRKEEGTVPPIRIPEKSEEEKNANSNAQYSGRSSIAQQIAEMTRELEEKDNQDK